MKRALFLLLTFVLLAGCGRPKGFTLKKIISDHHPSMKWEVAASLSSKELKEIVSQPYTYLGSGNHTYAFVSKDGNYVIKFFKQKHMRTKSWADPLPLPARRLFYPEKKICRRTLEREESFTSYKIAYELLKEETGLLYLHLNKGTSLNLPLTLIDQRGKSLRVNLDDMEFLIQRKATLVFEHLKALIDAKETEKALAAISSLLEVVAKRSQKGIYDKDLQFFKNFGFWKNQAIEIDIGEFKLDRAPIATYEELQIVSHQILDFIQEHAPDLRGEVDLKIAQQIEKYQ